MKNIGKFKKIRISVDGNDTKFQIGDHIRLHDDDVKRCVTKVSVDSDGCVSYLLTFINTDKEITSQWFTENDFRVMESLEEETRVMGFK